MNIEKAKQLLKVLPEPMELVGLMPGIHYQHLFTTLKQNDTDKIHKVTMITLIAIMMGTVHKLMEENPDWQDFLKLSTPEDEHDCETCDEREECEAFNAKNSPITAVH